MLQDARPNTTEAAVEIAKTLINIWNNPNDLSAETGSVWLAIFKVNPAHHSTWRKASAFMEHFLCIWGFAFVYRMIFRGGLYPIIQRKKLKP